MYENSPIVIVMQPIHHSRGHITLIDAWVSLQLVQLAVQVMASLMCVSFSLE